MSKIKIQSWLKHTIRWLLLGLLVYVLLHVINLDDAVAALTRITVSETLVLLLLYLLFSLAGIASIILLLPEIRTGRAGVRTAAAIAQSQLWGLITPGNLGEMSIVLLLRDLIPKTGNIFATFLLDRLITLVVLILVFLYFLVRFVHEPVISLIAVLLLLGMTAASFIWKEPLKNIFKRSGWYRKYPDFFLRFSYLYYQCPHRLMGNVLLTVIKAIVVGIFIWKIITVIETESASLFSVVIISNAIRIANYIALTPGNVGVTEFTALGAFSLIGIDETVVVVTYVIGRIITGVGTFLVFVIASGLDKLLPCGDINSGAT